MSKRNPLQSTTSGRLPTSVLRLMRRARAIISECNEAQRRAMQLRLSPDMYRADPDRAPDTYAEFLFRSGVPLIREPRAVIPPPSNPRSEGSL